MNLICASLQRGDIFESSPALFLPLRFLSPETSQRVACPGTQPRLTLEHAFTTNGNKLESFLFFLQEDLTLAGTRTKGRAGVS